MGRDGIGAVEGEDLRQKRLRRVEGGQGFKEDGDMVLGPTSKGRWAYACSKAVDEFLAIAYCRSRGLPTTGVVDEGDTQNRRGTNSSPY